MHFCAEADLGILIALAALQKSSAVHLPTDRSVKPRSVALLTSLAWRESELHRKIDLHLVRDLANSSFTTSESSGQETSGSRYIISSPLPTHFHPHYLREVKLQVFLALGLSFL
jgi:hypothetical protein